MVGMLVNYDKVGSERQEILPERLTAWAGIDSSFLELVIVGSLQVISSHRELKELWSKDEEVRKGELAEFEASEDGKKMLEYCKRFENGAWHHLSEDEAVKCKDWRKSTELIVPKGKASVKTLKQVNPEISAFFLAKKIWCDLNRKVDPPTWRPVTWENNPHFPFFDTKFLEVVSMSGESLNANVKLPGMSDEMLDDLREGKFPSVFTKKKQCALNLHPEERIQGSSFSLEGKNVIFLRKDSVSCRTISETFKGVRFSRSKDSGYWKAWITTEPTFQYETQYQDAMTAYWSGESPVLPAGTIISSFVVSISPTHHPDGEIGYMTFWGIDDRGSSIFLGSTKVSPYQVFQGQDANRMIWDYTLHEGAGGFRKGKASGASASVEVRNLLDLKRRITKNRKAMGFPETKLPVGENSYWWKKLRDGAETLRKQTAANVIAIQAVIEGVAAERSQRADKKQLSQGVKTKPLSLKFQRPKGVEEFRKLYPSGGYALLVPAPMGASHQRHKAHDDNRVLQIVGVAQIYELILSRAFPSGVNTMRVSKSGLFSRCAKPPRKLVEFTMPDPARPKKSSIGIGLFQFLGSGNSCEGKFHDAGDAECSCSTCKGTWPRGIVGSANLAQEFLNPRPKENVKKKKVVGSK